MFGGGDRVVTGRVHREPCCLVQTGVAGYIVQYELYS